MGKLIFRFDQNMAMKTAIGRRRVRDYRGPFPPLATSFAGAIDFEARALGHRLGVGKQRA
jgi:hypothetical protein